MPGTIVLEMTGKLSRGSLPGLCRRAADAIRDVEASVVVCDVGALDTPDAVAVDGLARLHLAIRRQGMEMEVRNAPEALLELLTFTGLREVLRPCEGSGIERERKTEKREHPLGVEEEAEVDDPPP